MDALRPQFREDILTPEQQALFRSLGPFADRRGYYLAGGTAVALRIGHRRSIDFDWFAEGPSVPPERIEADLSAAGLSYTTKSRSSALLDGHIHGIRTTFVNYGYPALLAPERWPSYDCAIAALPDLACMKLAAIAQRGSRKDFIAAFVIFKGSTSLAEALPQYRQKFRVTSLMPVLIGLTYFDDAEREPMPPTLTKIDWAQLKRVFIDSARQLRP
jgi:hypothetical protein